MVLDVALSSPSVNGAGFGTGASRTYLLFAA